MATQTIDVGPKNPATQIVTAGEGTHIIVNSSFTQNLTLGDTNAIQAGDPYTVPLTPQSYVIFDGTEDKFAIAPPGQTIPVYKLASAVGFFQSGINGGSFLVNALGLFIYSTNPPTPGSLIFSATPLDGTDPFGNAFKAEASAYQAPGIGQAVGLAGGEINFYTGPTSGAGPWTTQAFILATASQLQIGWFQTPPLGLQNIQVNTNGGIFAVDTFPYGGKRANILEANSPESYTTTVLAASPNLLVTGLVPGGIYRFYLNVIYDGDNTGGLKWKVVYDAGVPTGHANQIFEGTTGPTIFNGDTFASGLAGHAAQTVGVGSFLGLLITGEITLSPTTSAVTMQFAKNASSGTATKIYSGSFLELEHVG